MKKYLLLFICVFTVVSVFGQEMHRQINWVLPAQQEFLTPLAKFPNAYVTEEGVPLYQEVIELDGSNQRIEIVNPVFSILNTTSKKKYKTIQEELSVVPRYVYSKGKFQAILDFVPLITENGQFKKLMSFDIVVTTTTEKKSSFKINKEWKSSSVLSSGHWVKIKTSAEGVHKITYSQLQSWGFSNPTSVRLYGNGGYMLPKMNDDFYYDDLQQNAIYHGKDGEGNNCIFFYSTGTVRWNADKSTGLFSHELNDYSDYAYYFLSDQGNEKNVELESRLTTEATIQRSTFDEHVYHEANLENLIKSGRRWFGEKFSNGQQKSVTLELENPVSGQAAHISIKAAGRSIKASSLSVSLNNSSVDAVSFTPVNTGDALAIYADISNQEYELTNSGDAVDLSLKFNASNNISYAWLDFVTINYKRELKLDGQLLFRDLSSVGDGNITEFNLAATASNLQIWDVTDYTAPVGVPFTEASNQVSFKIATDELHEFVAFKTDASLPEPELVGDVTNQNLHQLSNIDMVIISHPDFVSQANNLAQFHREKDQFSIEVVTPSDVYNEFSGGAPDVAGIRNFLKMLYDQDNSSLKYVLLFGDGSYDNKNISGEATNFILTYQSPNSLVPTSSFVTDDFYALLDDGEGEYSGLIDVGIGRIPANTTTEAKTVVDKVMNYASADALGDWRNVICFIGDDEDASTHMSQADQLAEFVNNMNPSFYTDKIYFDAFKQESTTSGERYPDVTDAINSRVKEGVLILNYTGHANETSLAEEKVLSTNDINSWSNYNRLPIFVTATCEISRFDDDETTGGERILFNSNGGGIGLFSTTRVVYSTPNYILNKEFYEHVFSQDENGENLRMGEVLKRSKNGISTGINKRNFTLLADPALSLAFPKYKVETETINGMQAETFVDTIGSLSTVTVVGQVTDNLGNLLERFNGDLIPVVYDKKYEVETLGNGGETPFNYEMQNNIIYKGVTTVTSGRFEFSFIVPKDISYAVGKGKISYYANNGEVDAHGVFENFSIGGTSDGSINDSEGPMVNLYLNDTDFLSGGKVGKTSILIANIEDENGINTIGVGIGHDITAVLDDDNSNIMVLNDYYLSEKDSYKKGQVIAPLNNLSVGEHTLKFKVWDVLNNSTEVEIHFVVDTNLEILSVESYPNPASDIANIIFSHNRPDESFDAQLEIYSYTGSLVDVLKQRIGSNGSKSLPLVWQINESQMLIRNGAYLYRVIITADDGYSASKSGKIIISRY